MKRIGTKKIMFGCIALVLAAVLALPVYRLFRWKMYVWLPDYLRQTVASQEKPAGTRHVLFLFVDHYEPGFGESGVAKNREWLNNYRVLADRHRDSYGRKPQHTWFYAYDHHNEAVMPDLARAVFDGYGEVEFHWHHDHDTNDTFPAKLAEGVRWFNRYGALIDGDGRRAFGFIHGNWSLDNSRGPGSCGVSRELDILRQAGCYADFTFPALGEDAQPGLVNRIYYAADDDAPMSYRRGTDAAVGKRGGNALMIFEGPLNLTDYGSIEIFNLPNPKKIDSWVTSNIHVKGRPEWIFVKVFTHGVQSRKTIFGQDVEDMFRYLEKTYGGGDYRLHYVTAREAWNIVRAAEDGKTGDPDGYRNYEIREPLNRTQRF